MKKAVLFFLVSFCFTLVSAQISDVDYSSLLPEIKEENWKEAYKSSSKLLKAVDANDNSDNVCLVRFINLYAASGLVKTDKMKFSKIQEIATAMKGKKLLSPALISSMNPQNTLNKTFFKSWEGENKGFTTIATKGGAVIMYVEFDIVEPIVPRELHGQIHSCGGIISDVELNPEKTTDWIINIKVSKAFIKK